MQADSSTKETDAEIRRVCSILESVAGQYSATTPEYHAIKDAATAFIVVHQRQSLTAAFRKLKLALGGGLSPEMTEKLRSRGIDPDEFDAGDQSSEPT